MHMPESRVKSPGRKQARRKRRLAKKTPGPRSPKAAQIVDLVQALSAGIGSRDGVYLGRGIARLLTKSYGQRHGAVPRWVKELISHYNGNNRGS